MNVLETCIHDPLSEFVRKGEDAKDRFFPAAHPPLQGQRAPVLILRLSFSDFLDAAPSAPPPFLLLPPPPRALLVLLFLVLLLQTSPLRAAALRRSDAIPT